MSMLEVNEVHPVILPQASLITEAIVTWSHENVAYNGRSMTINNLRRNGFWVISANAVVQRAIFRYVTCHKLPWHLDIKKCQIYQNTDALKHHHLLTMEWICLDLLLSEKEDQIINNTVPYSLALHVGMFTQEIQMQWIQVISFRLWRDLLLDEELYNPLGRIMDLIL